MSNKAILEELAKQLDKISLHISRLNKNPEKVHELDIDFLADKIKDMYSASLDLETGDLMEEEISNLNEFPSDDTEELPSVGPEVGLPVMDENISPDADPDEVEENIPEDEPPKEDVKEDKPEASIEEENPVPEDTEEEPPKPKTTADLFSGTTTIADSFQKEEDRSIAARAVPPDVRDLKMAIGINDKFLFINELFKGDPSAYNEAIDHLNGGKDHGEANAALEGYRTEYNWPDNSEAYHRLRKIVGSKFPEH